MYKDKKILVVVPARGGSKGVPLKNIKSLAGKPLIHHTGDFVKKLDFVDQAVVSTDHDGIAEEAEACGLNASFRRPEYLSGDRIGDWDVLVHALEASEEMDKCVYDVVIMLQPTSPLRQVEHIAGSLDLLVEKDLDAVWTVSPTDGKAHPLKQLVLKDGLMDYYDEAGARIIARQQLQPVFHRNGIGYAITRDCLLEQKTIKGQKTSVYVVEEPVINIDTEMDFEWAEFLHQKGLI